MQNTRIFLHFSQVQVSSFSLWGCLPLVLVVPARVQPQHPLLVLKWPINCWPTFHGGHAHFSLRCFDNGNYLELSSGLAEDSVEFRFVRSRGIDSVEELASTICHIKKRKFIYIVLWVGCRARVAGICTLSSPHFPVPLSISVSLFAGFCQFNFLVYFTFQFKWRQIAGPLASCSICILRQENDAPGAPQPFDAYLYIVVNNFYSQSFAF